MMCKFIVDSCVDFYTTRTNEEAQPTGVQLGVQPRAQPSIEIATKQKPKSLSTHQIFSDAISKAVLWLLLSLTVSWTSPILICPGVGNKGGRFI